MLYCLLKLSRADKDVYCEKPFAETMADAREALKAANETNKIIQIGSQRRSTPNYIAANGSLGSGKFGKIVMVEMSWNVNQPGRWRRPELTSIIKESDTDWKRFQLNRPSADWDPGKYLEYRLFWPYSSGIPGQWMAHQMIPFTGLQDSVIPTALRQMAAYISGKMAEPILIL